MPKEKEEVKRSLHADMTVHTENPEESTQENLLELVSSVRYQRQRSAHENHSHCYPLTMNRQNQNDAAYKSSKENEIICRRTLNKSCTGSVC